MYRAVGVATMDCDLVFVHHVLLPLDRTSAGSRMLYERDVSRLCCELRVYVSASQAD